MKILFVCNYTLPHYGGIEVVVEELAKRLVKRGHQVKIVSSRTTRQLAYEKREGVEIIRVTCWNGLESVGIPYPLFSPSLLLVLIRAVAWSDIVHGHGYLYQNTLIALLLAKLIKRPTVLTEHAGFVQYRWKIFNILQKVAINTIGKLSLVLSDAVVVVGARAKEVIRNLIGQRKHIEVIPNGVDIEKFFPYRGDKNQLRKQLSWDERPKILFVGRFTARKGIDLLLKSVDKCFDLVLCGRQGELSITTTCTNVLIYSSVEQKELIKMYQAADIFVIPSHSEGGFPLSALEAMACGLPVIAVFDPIYLSYVNDKVVIFINSSPVDLRNAIMSLLNNPVELKRRSYLSVEWIQKYFNWEDRVDKHLALYEQLLNQKLNRKINYD